MLDRPAGRPVLDTRDLQGWKFMLGIGYAKKLVFSSMICIGTNYQCSMFNIQCSMSVPKIIVWFV